MRALPKETYRKAARFDRTLQKRREKKHQVSKNSDIEPINLTNESESTAEQLLQPSPSTSTTTEGHQSVPMEIDIGESNHPGAATTATETVGQVNQFVGIRTNMYPPKDLIDFDAPNTTGPSEALETTSKSLLDEDLVITLVEPGRKLESGRVELIPFFDSHMHLDRLASKARLGRPYNLSSCMTEMLQRSQPDLKPLYGLTGVTAVFCDPAEWSHLLDREQMTMLTSDERMHFAFGIHPKKLYDVMDAATNIKSEVLSRLGDLLRWEKAVALGEVGIDYTASANWENADMQESGLIQILRHFKQDLTERNLPVVLHCRNHANVDRNAHDTARSIVESVLGNDHPIQVHYFTGGKNEVACWLDSFPNTYFSVPVRAKYSAKQKEGWQAIPMERLLLETDAPYGANHLVIPYEIPLNCCPIANALEVSREELLRRTLGNAARFFNLTGYDSLFQQDG